MAFQHSGDLLQVTSAATDMFDTHFEVPQPRVSFVPSKYSAQRKLCLKDPKTGLRIWVRHTLSDSEQSLEFPEPGV
jgi:hypothetical protein